MIAIASLSFFFETAAACFEISHLAINAQHFGHLLSKVRIALFQVVSHFVRFHGIDRLVSNFAQTSSAKGVHTRMSGHTGGCSCRKQISSGNTLERRSSPSASVHPKRFSTPSLTRKVLCAGNLNPRSICFTRWRKFF